MARKDLNLEELLRQRAKTAARREIIKASGIFDDEDLRRVESSLEDYDRRIKIRTAQLKREASEPLLKIAADLGLNYAV